MPNEKRRVLLIGGEADDDRVQQLRAVLPDERVEPAQEPAAAGTGRPTAELRAVFLGHDSGISHLAAAVGTPALLLFGPTDPAIWAPENPQVRVLRSPSLTMFGLEVVEQLRDSLGELTS